MADELTGILDDDRRAHDSRKFISQGVIYLAARETTRPLNSLVMPKFIATSIFSKISDLLLELDWCLEDTKY